MGQPPATAPTAMMEASDSEVYGSYGGHSGYGHKDCEGIDIGLLLTTLLGLGVGFFTLFTKITMLKRRKRSAEEIHSQDMGLLMDQLHGVLIGGKAIDLTLTTGSQKSTTSDSMANILQAMFITMFKQSTPTMFLLLANTSASL